MKSPSQDDITNLESNEDQYLNENQLYKIKITRSRENLFTCLSFCLYLSMDYASEVKEMCKNFIYTLLVQNQNNPSNLPKRLNIFYNNFQLFKEFIEETNHSRFDLINLEILSLIVQKAIYVYEIDEHFYLRCLILNNQFDQKIMIFKDKLSNYDSLMLTKLYQSYIMIQSLVNDIFNGINFNKLPTKNPKQTQYNPFQKMDLYLLIGKSRNSITDCSPLINLAESVAKNQKEKFDFLDHFKYLDHSKNTESKVYEGGKFLESKIFEGGKFLDSKVYEARKSVGLDSTKMDSKFIESKLDHTPKAFDSKLFDSEFMTQTAMSLKKSKYNTLGNIPQLIVFNPVETPKMNESNASYLNNLSPFHFKMNNSIMRTGLTQIPQEEGSDSFVSSERMLFDGALPVEKQKVCFTNMQFSANFKQAQNIPKEKKKNMLFSLKEESNMNKLQILEDSKEIYTGILKHFDDNRNYGFILMDIDHSEIFFHFEDVVKSKGVTKEFLKSCRLGNIIKVSFECIKYIGKYDKSRKAVGVQILEDKQQLFGRN